MSPQAWAKSASGWSWPDETGTMTVHSFKELGRLSRKSPVGKIKNRVEKVRKLYARDGRRCYWCGRVMLPLHELDGFKGPKFPPEFPTIDHLVPRSHRGGNALSNLVVACPPCNHARGNDPTTVRPSPVAETTKCPDCENGVWAKADGRMCPTCDGAGELTAERTVTLLAQARSKIRSLQLDRDRARGKARALEHIIEGELGHGSARRDLSMTVQKQREIIRAMGDRIGTLKVELAEATGRDLAELIPFPRERERALGNALFIPHHQEP